MSKGLPTVLLMLGLAFGTCHPLSADSFSFSTLPANGSIAGVAGSTIGWGYTITNNSATDWLVTDNINAGVFLNLSGSPNILFDFPIIGPGTTVSVSYDRINALGLYEINWDAAAPAGFVNSGTFVVAGEWWDGDPFNGGNPIDAVTEDERASYGAMVSSQSDSIPEPSTLTLLGIGLTAVALRSGRRPGKSRNP